MTRLVVAAAILDVDGRVLIAQRPAHKHHGGLWEFPGGKVEPGERAEAALIRELREELAIDPCPTCVEPFAFASSAMRRTAAEAQGAPAPEGVGLADGSDIILLLYACRRWDGVAQALEHDAIAWVRRGDFGQYAMSPLDRELSSAVRDRLEGVRVTA